MPSSVANKLRLACLLLAASWIGGPVAGIAGEPDAPGPERAADFSLASSEGSRVSLSDFVGESVIVLSFFVSSCTHCHQEVPHLNALQADLGARGLQVISVAMDDAKDQASIRPFIRRHRYLPLVLLDPEGQATNRWNPRKRMPFIAVVGRDGMVHHRQTGFARGDEGRLRSLVEALLSKDKPSAR